MLILILLVILGTLSDVFSRSTKSNDEKQGIHQLYRFINMMNNYLECYIVPYSWQISNFLPIWNNVRTAEGPILRDVVKVYKLLSDLGKY